LLGKLNKPRKKSTQETQLTQQPKRKVRNGRYFWGSERSTAAGCSESPGQLLVTQCAVGLSDHSVGLAAAAAWQTTAVNDESSLPVASCSRNTGGIGATNNTRTRFFFINFTFSW